MSLQFESFKENLNLYMNMTSRAIKGSLNSNELMMASEGFQGYCDGMLKFCDSEEYIRFIKECQLKIKVDINNKTASLRLREVVHQ